MTRHLLATLLFVLGVGTEARAQQPFSMESDQPIEITADALEVVQAERLATFSGNVDAVQGDLVLSADRLLVHYRGDGDGDGPAGDGGSAGAIRRIEAQGSVVVTSPRETAEGENGVYDVAAALVTLEGSVVLTREENVIRGDRLELDLETGVSRVVAAATDETQPPDPNRRVRAVFTPGADEEAGSNRGGRGNRRSGGDEPRARERDEAPSSAEAEPAPAPMPKVKPGGNDG